MDDYGARYDDPVVGRFVSADSVQGDLQGMDPYAYVSGNPESRTDPTGNYFAPQGGNNGMGPPRVRQPPRISRRGRTGMESVQRMAIPKIGHIFRSSEGHFPEDTSENRLTILNAASDLNNLKGTDKYGTSWFAVTLADGTQAWARLRGDKIVSGGLNTTPMLNFDPNKGLIP